MFCSLTRETGNIDHYVLQISCLDIPDLKIERDGVLLETYPCKLSLLIYGGFDPGTYTITPEGKYVQYFILKEGKEVESGIINQQLTVKLERHNYEIFILE